MPSYKVNAPGFYAGELYDPNGKRKVLHVDEPFTKKNPMPSWVGVMPKESPGVIAKRKAQAASLAEKVKQDQADIAEAMFMGDGESATIETI